MNSLTWAKLRFSYISFLLRWSLSSKRQDGGADIKVLEGFGGLTSQTHHWCGSETTAVSLHTVMANRNFINTDYQIHLATKPSGYQERILLVSANPRSLKHLCRLKIRKCMGRLRLRCPVFMSFLPLPKRLKAYVLYEEYDLYGQESFTGTW